jgi:hypothetical protein
MQKSLYPRILKFAECHLLLLLISPESEPPSVNEGENRSSTANDYKWGGGETMTTTTQYNVSLLETDGTYSNISKQVGKLSREASIIEMRLKGYSTARVINIHQRER